MCGRFSLISVGQFLAERFDIEVDDELKPRYNISPGQKIPIITEPKKLSMAKWGLVPPWAKDSSIGYKMINARAETIGEKPAYRDAFRKRRCLIPADGFFEWRKKVPYYFTTGELFAFAGLYEVKDGHMTCTIITTKPNEMVRPIHDRMPVILQDEKAWLDTPDVSLLAPYAGEMKKVQVSTLVNTPKNEGERVIRPVKSLLEF